MDVMVVAREGRRKPGRTAHVVKWLANDEFYGMLGRSDCGYWNPPERKPETRCQSAPPHRLSVGYRVPLGGRSRGGRT